MIVVDECVGCKRKRVAEAVEWTVIPCRCRAVKDGIVGNDMTRTLNTNLNACSTCIGIGAIPDCVVSDYIAGIHVIGDVCANRRSCNTDPYPP